MLMNPAVAAALLEVGAINLFHELDLAPINRFKACVKPLLNEFSSNPILHPRDKHGMCPDIFSRRSRQVPQSALNLFRPPPMPPIFLYILPIMSLDPQCP